MFVGWIRGDEFEKLKSNNDNILQIDNHLFETNLQRFPNLCFKCVDNNQIVGITSAYIFENTTKINLFETINVQEVKQNLLRILMQNLQNENSIYSIVSHDDLDIFKNNGFEIIYKCFKFIYKGTQVAFNFSNSHAKEVTQEDFFLAAHKLDKLAYKENRNDFLSHDMIYSSSLKLATKYGYLHSRALSNKILVSPWIVANEAFMDAEKLLRALIYYRGLKQIVAFAPNIAEIVSLYNDYKFEKEQEYFFVYKGEKPKFSFDNIYAF